jgi:hypothetical protein
MRKFGQSSVLKVLPDNLASTARACVHDAARYQA